MAYEFAASIFRQCDKPTQSDKSINNTGYTLSTNAVTLGGGGGDTYRGNHGYKNRTIGKLRAQKLYSHCRACQKFGHRDLDHNLGGSIKYSIPSNDRPPQNTNTENGAVSSDYQSTLQNQTVTKNNGNNKIFLNFGMANLLQMDNCDNI